MHTNYQYCPHCKGVRKMSVSIAIVPLEGERQGLAQCLHCDTCLSYVGQIPFPQATPGPFMSSVIDENAGVRSN
jgi:hypothetical protein